MAQSPDDDRPLQVLVAGPLRGGTGDDPEKIAANVRAMEVVALEVLRRGHLPIVGEWISFPLMARAGSTRIGDAVYDELQHPIGERIVECSDAACGSAARPAAPTAWSSMLDATVCR